MIFYPPIISKHTLKSGFISQDSNFLVLCLTTKNISTIRSFWNVFNNYSQKKIKTALIYNSEFISGELRFVRKPNHGEKIIVYPMFILSLAAAASFLIPFSVGER